MAKYKVGQKFKDKEVNELIVIVSVAPERDYDNTQQYFVEVSTKDHDGKDIKFHTCYEETMIMEWFLEVE